MFKLHQVLAAVPGVTKRQVTYWLERGYIGTGEGGPGKGQWNTYTVKDLRTIHALYHISMAFGHIPHSPDMVKQIIDAAGRGENQATYGTVSVTWPLGYV